MEKKLRFVNRPVTTFINAPQDKIPVSRINHPFECNTVTDLPAVFISKFFPRHRALAVGQERFFLIFLNHKFWIQLEVCPGFHAEIREEIFLVDVNTSEPVPVGHRFDALDLPDFFRVGNGQRKDNGNRVTRNQARCGCRFNAGVKGTHYRPQQTEGKDSHGNAQNGQRTAQFVVKCVSKEDFEQHHD